MAGVEGKAEGGGEVTVNERVISALGDLGYAVEPVVYMGTDDIYLAFNYSAYPADLGDNAPGHEIILLQVHLFCPLKFNGLSLIRAIRKRLVSVGFTWPTVTDAGSGNRVRDGECQHIVFECEDAVGAE